MRTSDEDTANRPRRAKASWGRRLTATVVVLLVFFFLCRSLITNADRIRSYPFELHAGYLLASFACVWGAVLWYGVVWRRILSILDPAHGVSLPFAMQLSVYAWLGRYVPGKVVSVVSRVYAAKGRQVSQKDLYLSGVLDAVLAIVSGLVLALAFMAVGGGAWLGEHRAIYVMFLASASGLLVLGVDSRLFYWGINTLLRLAKRAPISGVPRMTLYERTSTLVLFALGQALRGLGFCLFVRALMPVAPPPPGCLMGVFILAGALGSASIIVPAGLGVRDGVLAVGLQQCLPAGIASVFSIASRVWETAADILLAAGVVLVQQCLRISGSHKNRRHGQ